MSRLLKEIAPHNAPGPRAAMTTTPCLVCGDDGEGMDCCPAALCTPCLQRAAKAQGSLFRCPLCRDDGAFVIAAKRRGVVANAKATPRYASGDDLTIRRRCNAPRCKAPGGRFVDAAENPLTRHGNTEKWALATCAHCGQTSRHRGCVKRFEGFRCDDCDVQVLERTPDDFRKGDRVEARFSGGPRWYGAEVVAVVEEGIRVKYDDDGSLETIRVAARIRHRAAEEDRSPPRSRRDEDEDEDDDEGAMRALRERVERDGGDALTVVRLDALLAGWKGSRRKKYTTGRAGFAYSFVAPDGTEIASIGRAAAAVLEAVPAADVEAATAEAPAPAAAAVRGTTAPSYDHGVRCEVRRVGDARWRRFASWRDAAQAFGVRHASNLSRLANGDPKLPAWVREQYEARRLADDDDDDAPAADESSVYNEAALRALRERVERDSGDEMTAARLDALLAGWKGSRERKLTHGRPNGFAYSFVAPDGTEITSITAATAAVLGAAAAPTDETAAAEAPAPAAAAPPLKVSLVSEVAAREELREHLRGLPGVEASQLDNLLAGWQATRRRRADGTTYSFISPGGEEFTSVSRAAWAACRLAPVERQLRAEAERLRVENDALRNDPAAATRREAKLRAELGRLRVENERLARAAQQPPVVVNHGRRDAGLGAWMAETFDHAVGTEPVVVNQVRPARRVTAGAPVVPPAPAVPAWPAPIEAPIPPLGPRAASLAADNAFRAASALALRNLRDSLHAVETLAASDFQGPMKRPVARLALKAHQLATHVAASETQLAERITWAPPSFWTPDEDWRLERLYSDECAAVDAAGLQGRSVRADFWARAAAALGTSRTAGAVESRWKALRAGTGARTRPWTSNEDERLRTMVGDLGASSDWRAIAARLGNGRTAGGVEARWRGLTSGGGPKRPRWRADEDERLTELVRAAPERASGSARPGMWDRIALSFPDRTASAVEHHWKDRNKKAQRHAMAAPAPPSKTLEKSQKIRCLQDNPKQKGTACRDRYEKYKSATTVKEFYEKEGTPADLDHDIGKGFIEVIQPTPAPSIAGEPDRKKRPREGPAAPRWSPDEEARLREVVEAERKAIAGGAPKAGVWGRVAAALGTNRTGGAVSQHWSAMNRGGTVTGAPGAARWTPDEEQHLRRLVEAERAPRGYIRGSFWDGAAASLGTHRTASALKSHWEVMNGAPRPSKKARTDEPPPPEEADDPFSLRACLASLFSWSPRMGS